MDLFQILKNEIRHEMVEENRKRREDEAISRKLASIQQKEFRLQQAEAKRKRRAEDAALEAFYGKWSMLIFIATRITAMQTSTYVRTDLFETRDEL
jgi:hypothetical protein